MRLELVEGPPVGPLPVRSSLLVKLGKVKGDVEVGAEVLLELEGPVGDIDGGIELLVVFVELRVRVALTA